LRREDFDVQRSCGQPPAQDNERKDEDRRSEKTRELKTLGFHFCFLLANEQTQATGLIMVRSYSEARHAYNAAGIQEMRSQNRTRAFGPNCWAKRPRAGARAQSCFKSNVSSRCHSGASLTNPVQKDFVVVNATQRRARMHRCALSITTDRSRFPMADEAIASVIPLHYPAPKKKAKKGATGAKVYRPRKKKSDATNAASPSSEHLIPLDFPSADANDAAPPVPATPSETASDVTATEPHRPPTVATPAAARPRSIASYVLVGAALGLAGVGIIINGWFARSLGSTETAGWLFLAIGVATDLVALAAPLCATHLWGAGQRATALVGWAVWLMTFIFAVTAGIGFASVNIADVTLARASRPTFALTLAQAALSDAMAARDRECKGGVGKFCREREATVAERRQAVDVAMRSVEQTADPQTDAAIRIVAWLSGGTLQPTSNDFAMLRLVLIALLPQIGGILLMVGRSRA
jgi:hypothetical protein